MKQHLQDLQETFNEAANQKRKVQGQEIQALRDQGQTEEIKQQINDLYKVHREAWDEDSKAQ